MACHQIVDGFPPGMAHPLTIHCQLCISDWLSTRQKGLMIYVSQIEFKKAQVFLGIGDKGLVYVSVCFMLPISPIICRFANIC